MKQNEIGEYYKVQFGCNDSRALFNPTCQEIDEQMQMIENKHMEYLHPLFYEKFK